MWEKKFWIYFFQDFMYLTCGALLSIGPKLIAVELSTSGEIALASKSFHTLVENRIYIGLFM